MKLSEAILLNGMVKPQGFGGKSIGSLDAPCALGGALQSVGQQNVTNEESNYSLVRAIWPWLSLFSDCPKCRYCTGRGYEIVYHLNDTHRWTREQIAEWVVTVEAEEIATLDSPEQTEQLGRAPEYVRRGE